MKHTPGPWHYCVGKCTHEGYTDILSLTPDELRGGLHISDGTPLFLGVWHNDSTAGLYGLEENAQLIAAAPDLLEAAELLVKNLPDGEYVGLGQLRMAIHKAKGVA